MNLGGLVSDVFRTLNESETAPRFFTRADVILALNEGLEELADFTEFYERVHTIPICANRTYYDLRTNFPPTFRFLGVRRIFSQGNTRWMTPHVVRDLDSYTSIQWERTTVGQPEDFFMRGLWWLGMHPKLSVDSGSVKVSAIGIPPRLVLDTDQPDRLPEEFTFPLVDYACYDLLLQKRELKKALGYYQDYMEGAAALRIYVKGRVAADRSGSWQEGGSGRGR